MTYLQKSIELYKSVVTAYDEYKQERYLKNAKDSYSKKCILEKLHQKYVEFEKNMKDKNLFHSEYELD